MHDVLSIKVSSSEKARLRELAKIRKTSLSSLLREGLEKVIAKSSKGSCYDLTARFFEQPGHIGKSVFGDLSTNKVRLKRFGQKA